MVLPRAKRGRCSPLLQRTEHPPDVDFVVITPFKRELSCIHYSQLTDKAHFFKSVVKDFHCVSSYEAETKAKAEVHSYLYLALAFDFLFWTQWIFWFPLQ